MHGSHRARVDAALVRLKEALEPSVGVPFVLSARPERVLLELDRLKISIEPDGPGFRQHPRFTLAHSQCDAETATWCAARPWDLEAIAQALHRFEEDVAWAPREVPIEEAFDAPDGSVLGQVARAFERHYRVPLRALDLARDIPSIVFPQVAPGQNLFLRAPRSFDDLRMRAHVRDLGFDVRDGDLRVVPLPSSFEPNEGGLVPRFVERAPVMLSPARWVRSVVSGTLPINTRFDGDSLLHRIARASARASGSLDAMWNTHFCALGHDMSLHAFAMHRLGAEEWDPLRAALRAALRLGRAKEAADFVEGTLTRHCVRLWNEATSPEDWDVRFARHREEILDELVAATR